MGIHYSYLLYKTIHLPFLQSVQFSTYPLSIYPCICLSSYLLKHLFIYPFIYLSIHLSIHLSTFQFIYLSIYLPIKLSMYPFICLSYLSFQIQWWNFLFKESIISNLIFNYLSLIIYIYLFPFSIFSDISIFLSNYPPIYPSIYYYFYLSLSLSYYLGKTYRRYGWDRGG